MTHRTVPLDLLVRVRDVLDMYCACGVLPMFKAGDFVPELTAQIEQVDTSGSNSDLVAQASKATKADTHADLSTVEQQREGQGEPVAWQYFDAGQWWPTRSIDKYPPNIPTRALYATPQDSVPAWAMELVAKWRAMPAIDYTDHERGFLAGMTVAADELESRALALASAPR